MSFIFNISVITLYPELFPGPLGISLVGKALIDKIWSLEVVNLRMFSDNKHSTVDDRPFGGGAGMVLMPEAIARAIDHIKSTKKVDRIISFSPRGTVISQREIEKISKSENQVFICGRFEGIDERVLEEYDIELYSLGDFVLCGGEIACMAMLESCIRLIPGVLGNSETLNEESFGADDRYKYLLEYPHYTRPAVWRGREVPSVLLSGDHKKIDDWRFESAKTHTKKKRPDLFKLNIEN